MNKKLLSLVLTGAIVIGGVGVTTNTVSANELATKTTMTEEKSARIITNMYIDHYNVGSSSVRVGCGGNVKNGKVKLVHTYKMNNSVMTQTATYNKNMTAPDVARHSYAIINLNRTVKKGDKFTATITSSSGTKTMTITIK